VGRESGVSMMEKQCSTESIRKCGISNETRIKLSESHKGKTASEKTKKKMSESGKKRFEDPKEREKLKGRKSVWVSINCAYCGKSFEVVPSSKNRVYCSVECRIKDPAYLEKLGWCKGKKLSSEHIKNQVESRKKAFENNPKLKTDSAARTKKQWTNPTIRERMSCSILETKCGGFWYGNVKYYKRRGNGWYDPEVFWKNNHVSQDRVRPISMNSLIEQLKGDVN
jgi:endogenous inhibitor of DNA gyrase (YacG/DUF329 family)